MAATDTLLPTDNNNNLFTENNNPITIMKHLKSIRVFILPVLLATSVAIGQTGSPNNDDIEVLDPWDVSQAITIGYGSTTSAGGTRINLSFQDVPMSVVTLNREFMNDIGTLDSYDALRFVAGMGPASTVSINSMTIRGVEVRAASFNILDGLPAGGIEQETEFIERYEVVKGPAGTLYGEHSIGGLVNRVYKRPQKEMQTTVKATLSSIGTTWQGSVDHTGPINEDRSLTYRVIGVVRDGESAFGGDDDKWAVFGALEYQVPGTTSRLWMRGENRWVRTPHETATVFFDGAGVSSLDVVGVKTPIVPMINLEERRFRFLEAGFSTSFPGIVGDWDIRTVGRYWQDRNLGNRPAVIPLGYSFLDAQGNVLGQTGTSANPDTQPRFSDNWTDIRLTNHVTRTSGPSNGQNWGAFVDITGNFDTGPLNHRMILYTQVTGNRSRSHFTNYTLREEFGGSNLTGNLNLDNAFSVINPRLIPNDFSVVENPQVSTDSFASGERFNVGLQDNVYLWDQRILLVGGIRYDYIRNNGATNFLTGTTGQPQTTTNWVTKGAVVVKPFDEGVSFFYNYAETFEPRFGELVAGSGIPFKNLEGETNEMGVKLQLFDSRLIATGSYYRNRLLNNPIRIFNPNTGLDEFVQEGTTKMDGWEIDMTWMIDENWLTLFAIGDVNSINPNGLRQRNVQNDLNYKALVRYSFSPDTQLEGLALGASVVRVGERAGDNPNSFVTDGFNTFDAFATYTTGNWRFQANAMNILDKEAVASSILASLAIANQPRSVRIMAEYSF